MITRPKSEESDTRLAGWWGWCCPYCGQLFESRRSEGVAGLKMNHRKECKRGGKK